MSRNVDSQENAIIDLTGLNVSQSIQEYRKRVNNGNINSRFSVYADSFFIVQRILASSEEHKVKVLSCSSERDGCAHVTLEKATASKLTLLQLTAYRCPGPIAEVRVRALNLDGGEILQLGVYIPGFRSDLLVANLRKSGYLVANEVGGGVAPFFAQVMIKAN